MNVLRFLNRQKVCALDRKALGRVTGALLEELRGRGGYTLGVHFVGAREMTRLNEKYLRHEGSTDVITFDYTPSRREMERLGLKEEYSKDKLLYWWRPSLNGEIFICTDEALVQARRFGVSWQMETVRYLIHGLLHLDGCDDSKPALRREMKKRENKLLKELSRRFDLGKLGQLKKTRGADERK
jgi:probable rRNA maturation factor